jgi:1-acyl-sn-glycerol-3-phosphate acyltransferase
MKTLSKQMLNFLPSFVVGTIAISLLTLNIFFWCGWLIALAIIKLLIPVKAIRKVFDVLLIALAKSWVSLNSGWMKLTQNTNWDVKGIENMNTNGWYLVSANHQSWVDILVLQHVFNGKIPFIKFFLKQELIRVPIMGLCWWALDFPFMKRFSKSYLEKHPEMKGKDLETTRIACEKFSIVPTSVMNFLEGTRLTKSKHEKQNSPYKHLLKPKAGGIAFAINAMGDKFQSLLDVTIVYPDGIPTFMDFLFGRVKNITVRVNNIHIPEHFSEKDYNSDPDFKKEIQQWTHDMWLEKDALISKLSTDQLQQPLRS